MDFEYMETDPSGRYGRFKEVLGKGAIKTVYKAFDQLLGMEVAWNQVKLNDIFRSPEELQRLYAEVHLLSTLNHDSIIHFYTSWVDVDGRTFNFITEMLTSGTLREYRQRYRQVDIRAVKNWSRQILNGLVYLHEHDPPVIHRDLKCDNIFVNGHLGQVKIGDLGFAAILRGSCHAHSVIGTPEFMAPELYEEEYDELVDIYSFGMCVLEMVTSEYPYGECTNPAQIYKKVTSGKLPDAFYRIHDEEARRFVGKCLETASKRLPAKDLLLDPFLATDEVANVISTPNYHPNNPTASYAKDNSEYVPSSLSKQPSWSNDMKITGKMNPEDDTIYLKVQIADKYGSTRNIYFPFDIHSDTPIDVATEMVKELEINDREPDDIAAIIEREISGLIPQWKDWEMPPSSLKLNHDPHGDDDNYHTSTYNLNYDDDDNDQSNMTHHHLYSPVSSSSQASFSALVHPSVSLFNREMIYGCDWLHQDDDDGSSQSSLHSGMYSNMNYQSASEQDSDPSPSRRENQPHQNLNTTKCTTRFCPETTGCYPQEVVSSISKDQRRSSVDNRNPQLTRMKSFVDVRSQLLHRSLVEEVNKRRLFKTVGAVENIGFQSPIEATAPPSSPTGAGWSVKSGGGGGFHKNKKKLFNW